MADHAQPLPPPPAATRRTRPEVVSSQKALFLLSDWSGPVCYLSWFGRHSPFWRMYLFVLLSSWAWTLSTLYQLYVFRNSADTESWAQIPIVQARTKQEMETIKQSHQACFQSLCEEVGRKAPIDCIVNDDGVTSRVEFMDDDDFDLPSSPIYFPEACHEATEATFGARYLDGLEDDSMPPIAFISLPQGQRNNETTSDSKVTSLLTLLPDCSLMISDPEISPAEMQALKEKLNLGEWNVHSDLYQEFQHQNQRQDHAVDISLTFDLLQLANRNANQQLPPGHRESHVLKNVLCVDEMPPEIQQHALPQLATIYNFMMDYRHEILTVLLYGSNLCFSFMTIAWLSFRLIIPSMAMKRVLVWPSTITTVDIWRTLLLLCLTTSFRLTCPLLAGVMALGALWYGNFTAAMEWSFLGMTGWAATDTIYPILDDLLGNTLAKLDGLNILYMTLHLFIIGEGWWKLVTIYVVYRAYRALYESIRPPAIEQTQLNLNGQQPQEHVKVD